ncbi:MAG: SRPBCC domain-containing protein [Myxococcales bacterium]|nr:SRPBCC domain-containing protein [Myxococcales bacterium]
MTGDRVRVSVWVSVPPQRAFVLFTEHIDEWWQRGRRFRHTPGPRSILRIEPGVGGRLFETWDGSDGQPRVVVTGQVEIWEPPAQLQLRWRNATFSLDEHTTIHVAFRAVGERTEVTVTHSGWAALRSDHPARHGQRAEAFVRRLGQWWGDLLTSLREHQASGTTDA